MGKSPRREAEDLRTKCSLSRRGSGWVRSERAGLRENTFNSWGKGTQESWKLVGLQDTGPKREEEQGKSSGIMETWCRSQEQAWCGRVWLSEEFGLEKGQKPQVVVLFGSVSRASSVEMLT